MLIAHEKGLQIIQCICISGSDTDIVHGTALKFSRTDKLTWTISREKNIAIKIYVYVERVAFIVIIINISIEISLVYIYDIYYVV